ncbi:MAG: UDP-N-acetylmuramate--L-alanine ligase [Acidimicrobiaceae bacterium]|nr:UDP-N-acetylmuramate--L-alanine ligase [Acidimicrobiaceae bacterium]
MTVDFTPKRVHIVGIGGAGMSAIAIVLTQQGHRVSGSDLKASVAFERLRTHGVELFLGHAESNVHGAELVAISSAIARSNPEVLWAHEHQIPVVTRSELLPMIISGKTVIGVAGTHGKTTTTSMLALSLMTSGRRPSFIVGGELNEIGTNALWDEGSELVIEADESDGTFLHLGCYGVIVTNIEPDHLDYYGSYEALKNAFGDFVSQSAGPRIICADSPDANFLLDLPGVSSYGFSHKADYLIKDVISTRSKTTFRVVNEGLGDVNLELAVPGRHNVSNATAALALADQLGANAGSVVEALSQFTGVARRFQHRGTYNGATLIDDYAHLPGEIEAVLETAASQEFDRVVAIFQPHRYSRVASLYREFAESFSMADVVVITDVYSAGEMPIPGVTGELISALVEAYFPDKEVHYLPQRHKVASLVQSLLRPGDICLTLGAGDLTLLYGEIPEEPVR